MKRLFILLSSLVLSIAIFAKNIPVKNIDELNRANKWAQPGDTIVLQNGIWNDVIIKLNCSGTQKKPIVFKAQNAGKVFISGVSQLRIGGNFIIVDGLNFSNGSSPGSAVIDFRINDKQLANNCRVTNSVINDFNKPKRMDEDYWVSFSGKNNRLDHCSFLNKKNLGVLLAVILDDERSRENFHSIDHNYFGVRPPLGSNGGEIIRVGVSQHCQYNSNTQIRDNFFEHCDGETEIVSIKSGSNVVSNNVFKECQGSVVLRHGDNNTVTNNLFLGNGKEGTGGVRIINRGQWVINNFFFKCKGTSFRSPMAIMNGIPNSPANRYVQVTDAVVMNNSFVDCTPISFGEGSDAERTLPPNNVLFAKNVFYSDTDNVIYKVFDDISGIRFSENKVSLIIKQKLIDGFQKTSISTQKNDYMPFPIVHGGINRIGIDSLMAFNKERFPNVSAAPGFTDLKLIKKMETDAYSNCGAKWFVKKKAEEKWITVSCHNTTDIKNALAKNNEDQLILNLTGDQYLFTEPIAINKNTRIISSGKKKISIQTPQNISLKHCFEIKGGKSLMLDKLSLDLSGSKFENFIITDTSGGSDHSNFSMTNCTITNFSSSENSIFFRAMKSTICDSVVIANNLFQNNKCLLFSFADEDDKKGYYNVEKLRIENNVVENHKGSVLQMLRGGNDESTMGPKLLFQKNKFTNCEPAGSYPAMISLFGTQQSFIENNSFINCFTKENLIQIEDVVRAVHLLSNNLIINSGKLITNQFTVLQHNMIK